MQATKTPAVADAEARVAELVAKSEALARTIVATVVVIVLVVSAAIGMFYTGDPKTIRHEVLRFAVEFCQVVPKALLVTGFALMLAYGTEWVRQRRAYDVQGAARQVQGCVDRVGTEAEQPGDSLVAAGKYAVRTAMLIAYIVLLWSATT